jgi:hypothetical protein
MVKKAINMKYYLLTYNGSLNGESAEDAGGKYDLNFACKICGTGARFIEPIPIKGIKGNKDFFQTLSRDFFVSKKMFQKLHMEGINISFCKQVIQAKSNTLLDYFYFRPIHHFPGMDLSLSEGISFGDLQCKTCKQNGFGDKLIKTGKTTNIIAPRRYVYHHIPEELLNASDIFYTWEHFGSSRLKAEGIYVIGFARPRIILSENVKIVFEEEKIKNVVFEEVSIVNLILTS